MEFTIMHDPADGIVTVLMKGEASLESVSKMMNSPCRKTHGDKVQPGVGGCPGSRPSSVPDRIGHHRRHDAIHGGRVCDRSKIPAAGDGLPEQRQNDGGL